MSRQHRLPPSAASLSASMRDLGYSLETAVADLIDNSITANATKVDVICDVNSSEPSLAVIDNGCGMEEAEMLKAMRHGSANPEDRRDPDDLGRFGLGLKTASFSQCRRLTLISRKHSTVSGTEWDLDTVDSEDDWLISILDPTEIPEVPFFSQLPDQGTAVVWRNLDRLSEAESGHKRDEIVSEKLAVLEKHIALVFHRFLTGEVKRRKKLQIAINGRPVFAFDPFCRKNPATQVLPEEVVRVDGADVRMQPYILPHHSKLSAAEYDFYRDRSDFLSNQGAYIYRNGRLMAWGDWFRLVPKGEVTKLARIQIDFPSSLDKGWTIDIKKSRATPPHQIRERLRQIINRITGRSEKVHRGRGKKLFSETNCPLWERFADKGAIRYSVNQAHPLIVKIKEHLTEEQAKGVQMLIDAIEAAVPVEMIYSDFSTSPKDIDQAITADDQLTEKLEALKELIFKNRQYDVSEFREIVLSTKLFYGREKQIEDILGGESV